MITNERQYRITKAQLRKFEEATAAQAASEPSDDVDPRIHAAMGEALHSEADELRRQLRQYEELRSGRITSRSIKSLSELPTAMIEARIAGHVTQKSLAGRVGVAEQQVQRWEATRYSGVSIERIQAVADALRVQIIDEVHFKTAPVGRRSSRSATRTKPRNSGRKRPATR